jgi:hypothetical protein
MRVLLKHPVIVPGEVPRNGIHGCVLWLLAFKKQCNCFIEGKVEKKFISASVIILQ